MSYYRVIPRDLFNESKLLKCLARIYIEGERYMPDIELVHDGEPFQIEQDPNSGAIYVANVEVLVRGKRVQVYTPLNAKSNYPMLFEIDGEEAFVFTDLDGKFTDEFLALIKGEPIAN